MKKGLLYTSVFLFFFLILYIICFESTSFDFLWSYGFSHAIRVGEIPYLEFNTISTPFYAFLMSLGLFIKDSFVVFILEQAFLCTALFYILHRYIGKKVWILLSVLCFPFFKCLIGSYNFMVLLLLVLLCYMEDSKKDDFWIGIVLGLLILSKQTIGGVAVILNFIFLHDFKRIFSRVKGMIIPLGIFLFYLILTGSFLSFFDLCFLGLFDFGSSNKGLHIYTVVSILLLGFSIYYSIRRKDIKWSYVLSAFFFPFPIFDGNHFTLFLFMICLLLVVEYSKKIERFSNLGFVFLTLITLLNIIVKYEFYNDLVKLDLPHFENYYVQKKDKEKIQNVYQEYVKDSNAIMIGTQAMLFDIASNKKITYFDVPLTGNYGLKGTKGMIEEIQQMHDVSFYIPVGNHKKQNPHTQLDYSLLYVAEQSGEKIKKVSDYTIYYKK